MDVLDFLQSQGMPYTLVEHPEVETIEAMEALNLPQVEFVVKNLFLRDDKKRKYYLVVVQKDKKVNLKALRALIESRPLTFASEGDLFTYLGLIRGSVTPLGILNDKEHRVQVVLDKEVLEYPVIGVHPNRNTATIWLKPQDLVALVEKQGNELSYVEIA